VTPIPRPGRWLVFVALLAFTLAGCAEQTFTASARVAAMSRLERDIARTRELGRHPGPRLDTIDPSFRAAADRAERPEEFRRAVVRYLDQLADGHAAAFPDTRKPVWLARARVTTLGDRVWMQNAELPQAGAPPTGWFVVDRIDGYPYITSSAGLGLLMSAEPRLVRVEGRDVDGTPVDVQVPLRPSWECDLRWSCGAARDDQAMAGTPLPNALPGSEDFVVFAGRLGEHGQIGYLAIPRLNSRARRNAWDLACALGLVHCADRREIQRAAHALRGCSSIIIDLQGNSGGTCVHAGQVLFDLLPRSMARVPFAHVGRGGDPGHRWDIAPEHRRFPGQLVVLIDDHTASAAEHIAACLKGAANVSIVGVASRGAEYSIRERTMPGGFVATWGGTATVWDTGFSSAEQRPVKPDVEVPFDEELLKQQGPIVAAVQRRRRAVDIALRFVGLKPSEFLGAAPQPGHLQEPSAFGSGASEQ
jgi:hypothetical protein